MGRITEYPFVTEIQDEDSIFVNANDTLKQIKKKDFASNWNLIGSLTLDKTSLDLSTILEKANEILIISRVKHSNINRYFSSQFPKNVISTEATQTVLNVGSYFYNNNDTGFIALNTSNSTLSVRYCIFSGSQASNYEIEVYYR